MGRARRVWTELGLAVELAALTAVAFTRPVLESFGTFPAFFELHRATRVDVVVFGVLVTLVPALIVALAGCLSWLAGERVRNLTHVALVGLLAATMAWRLTLEQTGWTNRALPPFLLALVGGLVLGGLRWWRRTAGTAGAFLRYAGLASLLFLGQFLVTSDVVRTELSSEGTTHASVAAQVAEELGEERPPVVMLVFDELPTSTLLDGEGRIDEELFPNIAELAEQSTWYRNHTTVAPTTGVALPALLTGRYPDDDGRPVEPTKNLFALLAGAYEPQVHEPWSEVCQRAHCPGSRRFSGQSALAEAAIDLWWSGTEHAGSDVWDPLDEFGPERYDDALDRTRAVPAQLSKTMEAREGPAGRSVLVFHHELLPHRPYYVTDAGERYEATDRAGAAYLTWPSWGAPASRQAHVLQTQAVDRMVGELVEGLRAEGLYDDTLIVLTADHGVSFLPQESARLLAEDNKPYLLWTPLLVKAPGQTQGVVDDHDVRSVDVVPIVAELLGFELPWAVDGLAASELAGAREGEGKPVILSGPVSHPRGEGWIEVDADHGLSVVLDATAVDASGPDAVWMRTEHGELLREPLEDLRQGDEVVGELTLDVPASLADFDDVARSEPLPLELVLETDLEVGTVVVLGLNGSVAAVAEVEPGAPNVVHALAVPEKFEDGTNDLSAFVVEGEPGDETLQPLDLAP